MINNQNHPIKLERFHPFNQRTKTLDKFQNETPAYRLNHQRNVMIRAKCGTLTSTSKSLDILRSTLQECFNQEIDCMMQKYLNQYFKPAIENIKRNNGEQSVSDNHIQTVFRQLLEDAKKMYLSSELIKTPTIANCIVGRRRIDGENNFNIVNSSGTNRKQFTKRLSTSEIKMKKIKQNESREIRKAMLNKRKLSNKTNSSRQQVSRGRPPLSNKSKTVDLGSDNLNPDRITINTRFVLGSKANKALGFGSARGRLYTKHTDLFRYIGDVEDKQYLHEQGLFPISGARAFLVVKDDIEKILKSDEYVNAPGVNGKEISNGFTLPDWIIQKIKAYMNKMKIEREKLAKPVLDNSICTDTSVNSSS